MRPRSCDVSGQLFISSKLGYFQAIAPADAIRSVEHLRKGRFTANPSESCQSLCLQHPASTHPSNKPRPEHKPLVSIKLTKNGNRIHHFARLRRPQRRHSREEIASHLRRRVEPSQSHLVAHVGGVTVDLDRRLSGNLLVVDFSEEKDRIEDKGSSMRGR